MHDYVVAYARDLSRWHRNLRPRTSETDEDYDNPDDDPNGAWISHALQSRNAYSKGIYAIRCPGGRLIDGAPHGTYWRLSEKNFWKTDKVGKVWWGRDRNNSPRIKEYLIEAKSGVVPVTWWPHQFAGTNSGAKTALRQILGETGTFITPKPVELILRILELASSDDSLILDSFAGSGTTGHAVLRLNKEGGGNRRFILVEMDPKIASEVTAIRLKRVAEGYKTPEEETVEGLGGGFRYCKLGEPLFDSAGQIKGSVSFGDLARHVFFVTTGQPLPKRVAESGPMIGVYGGTAVYLLYNGILGDKRPGGGNVLTGGILSDLPPHLGRRVVFGEATTLSSARLRRENIEFRQIPYDVRAS